MDKVIMKMKLTIINKIAKLSVLLIAIASTTSCKDYLNIDNYFDDEFNIDSAFSKKH